MVVIVAAGEFEQTVGGGNVLVRIADREIRVADVGRRHREPYELMLARRDAALLYATEGRGQVLRSYHPMLPQRGLIDDEIGLSAGLAGGLRREHERSGEKRRRRQADHNSLFHDEASCVCVAGLERTRREWTCQPGTHSKSMLVMAVLAPSPTIFISRCRICLRGRPSDNRIRITLWRITCAS